jgi:hypothetical protein
VLGFDVIDCPDEYGGDSTMFLQTECYNSTSEASAYLPKSPEGTEQSATPETSRRNEPLSLGTSNTTSPGVSAGVSTKKESLRHLSTARDYYTQANVHFEVAKSPRGSAAIALRNACTLIIEDIQPYRLLPGQSQNKEQVKELLNLSQRLYEVSGDVQLGKMIQTHVLLTAIVDLPSLLLASSLGRWADMSHNNVLGLCLGLLAFRLGQYFRFHCRSEARAISTLEISRKLFNSMPGFETAWSQVLLSQVSIYRSQRDLPNAKIFNLQLKECWL